MLTSLNIIFIFSALVLILDVWHAQRLLASTVASSDLLLQTALPPSRAITMTQALVSASATLVGVPLRKTMTSLLPGSVMRDVIVTVSDVMQGTQVFHINVDFKINLWRRISDLVVNPFNTS